MILPRKGQTTVGVASLHEAGRGPILVTGMPRSGTTWVARLLAQAPGVSLTGREPMNPRGRQYGLGGTLKGWTRLTAPSSRQSFALRSAYAGLNPCVYSRYGRGQWAACLPWVRGVVKDPFALLSIPTIHRLTGAMAVVVYRHPGAALASYRRMGWRPDVSELAPIVEALLKSNPPSGVTPPPSRRGDEVNTMAWFWNVLYSTALHDLTHAPGSILVSHAELASGGIPAQMVVFDHLKLHWVQSKLEKQRDRKPQVAVDQEALHNLDRASGAVAEGWRESLTVDEVERIEDATSQTREALDRHRLPLASVP